MQANLRKKRRKVSRFRLFFKNLQFSLDKPLKPYDSPMTSSTTAGKNTILFIQNDETDPPHLVGQWLAAEGFEIKTILAYADEEIPSQIGEEIAGIIPLG